MTEPKKATEPKRRVIVALDDASNQSEHLIAAASALARELSAQLLAVFVEDSQIHRLASLPGMQAITPQGSTTITKESLARQMRLQARNLRKLLERSAERHGIAWQLEVRQGSVTDEILQAAAPGDVLTLNATSTRTRRARLGSTAQAVSSQAKCSVLIVNTDGQKAASVVRMACTTGEATAMSEVLGRITGQKPENCPEEEALNKMLALRGTAPGYLVMERNQLSTLGLGTSELLTQVEPAGILLVVNEKEPPEVDKQA